MGERVTEPKDEPGETDYPEIRPSPYLTIIKDNVEDLIRITEAMGTLKTEEAEVTVAKALAYATLPPKIYEGDNPQSIIDELQPGGIKWKRQ